MHWLGPLLGFVLTVPAFFLGYLLDDHILRQISLGGDLYRQRPSWDIFNFVASQGDVAYYRERGILLAWWTPDTFRSHFFRPLVSLIHTFQFRSLDDHPWVMHVGLAMIYALSIYLVARLLTKLCNSSIAAGIGVLLFAINDTHANSTGIIWGCNTVLCNAFGMGALLMHLRWRQNRSVTGLILFCVSFATALLCSEGGLALMGYLVAYALFREAGSPRKKLLTLVPGGLIAGAYLLFYAVQQYGVKASGVYQSPTDDLLGCAFAVLGKTAMLVQSQVFSFPPLTLGLTLARTPGIIVGVLLAVGAILLFRKMLVANRTLAFFGTGMVLSIVPFALANFDSHWLAAVMNSSLVRMQIDQVQYGAAQEQINITAAVNFQIPTPPLPEQRAISYFLQTETGNFDALAAEAQKAGAGGNQGHPAQQLAPLGGPARRGRIAGETRIAKASRVLRSEFLPRLGGRPQNSSPRAFANLSQKEWTERAARHAGDAALRAVALGCPTLTASGLLQRRLLEGLGLREGEGCSIGCRIRRSAPAFARRIRAISQALT